ncbi:MAG: fibronectin type III domain-containing protein [bacterium]|nr:fibronectin type III domain-containing protein [bacterium]
MKRKSSLFVLVVITLGSIIAGREVRAGQWPAIDPASIRPVFVFMSDHILGGGNFDIYQMDQNGVTTNLTGTSNQEIDPSFSFDKEKIVYASNAGGDYEIGIMKANGSDTIQLTDNSVDDRYPAISSDGQWVVFSRRVSSDRWDIWKVKVNNPADSVALVTNQGRNESPCFSPDGTKIVFSSNRLAVNNFEVYTANATDGDSQTNLTNTLGNDLDPCYSPDGSKIGFASDRYGNQDVFWMSPDGSNQTRITSTTAFEQYPSFSPDGSQVIFTSYLDDYRGEIYMINIDGSGGTRLTSNTYYDKYPSWGGAPTIPADPGNLTITAVGATTIDLKWQDNSWNEAGFKIERGPDISSFSEVATVNTNRNTYHDTGLVPLTHYFYRVRAYNTQGHSTQYSNTVDTTTLDIPPLAPTNLTAATISINQLNLSWTDNSTGEDSFTIQKSKTAGFGGGGINTFTLPGETTTYSDPDCIPATTYYYRVRAERRGLSSDWSNTAEAATCDTSPNAPSGLNITGVSGEMIALAWTDHSNNEDSFSIERSSLDTSSFTKVGWVASGLSIYEDAGLIPQTQYYYRVRAVVAGCGQVLYSSYSNSVGAATSETPPVAPGPLMITVISDARIDLSWTDNSDDEDTFVLQRSSPDSTSFSQAALLPGNGPSAGTTITYQDISLEHNTKYYYRAAALRGSNFSVWSNIAAAVTCDILPPAPANLSLTLISGNQIDLTWTAPWSNADSFEVWRSFPDTGNYTLLAKVDTPTVTYSDTSCLPGVSYYYYRIRARNITCPGNIGYSDYSNEARINTNLSSIYIEAPDKVGEGSSFEARVMVDRVSNLDIVWFSLTYNSTVVSTPSVSLGDLTSGSVLVANTDTPGLVKAIINVPGTNGVSTTTPSSLARLLFGVIGGKGDTAKLTLPLPGSADIGLGDNMAREILILSTSGDTVTIIGLLPGDANCDGQVDPRDITIMEMILVGVRQICSTGNLDLNSDGIFDAADILSLARILVDLPPTGAPQRLYSDQLKALPCRDEKELGAGEASPTLHISPSISGESSDGILEPSILRFIHRDGKVVIEVDKVDNLDVVYLDLRYDHGGQVRGVMAGDLVKETTPPVAHLEPGRIRVVLNITGLSGVSGSGSLLEIEIAGNPGLSIEEFFLGNSAAALIPIQFSQIHPGFSKKDPGMKYPLEVKPDDPSFPLYSRLLQNTPNPLNPETWIPYELSFPAEVAINIYTLAGQLVRTLDLGAKEAGFYLSGEKAAYWDGKDNDGREIASGVYLYQFKAGGFISTRKMIVLK